METAEILTEKIDSLKKEMDNHPKNSEKYTELFDMRKNLMKKRSKIRAKSKKDTDSVYSGTSSVRSVKRVSMNVPSDSESDDDFADSIKYLKEQEQRIFGLQKEETPKENEIVKENDQEIVNNQEIPKEIPRETPEIPKETLETFIKDFEKEMSSIMGNKKEISFANNPTNEAVARQFKNPVTRETLIGDITKIRALMGLHPDETLKDKSFEDLHMTLKDCMVKFKARKHSVSEMLANLHVVGYTALLNMANPIVEESCSFTFADVKKNAEEAKPVLINCYEDIIENDPYLGKYLLQASSGTVGLLSTSALIAARSFETDQKKFVGNTQ